MEAKNQPGSSPLDVLGRSQVPIQEHIARSWVILFTPYSLNLSERRWNLSHPHPPTYIHPSSTLFYILILFHIFYMSCSSSCKGFKCHWTYFWFFFFFGKFCTWLFGSQTFQCLMLIILALQLKLPLSLWIEHLLGQMMC